MAKLKTPLIIGFSLLISQSPVMAEAELKNVLDTEKGAIREGQSSQKKIDNIVGQTDKLFEEYKQVNKQTDGLKVYNAQLEKQIDNQKTHLDRLAQSIDQASLMGRQISPLMHRMLDGLKTFVELDLPFHYEERTERVQQLLANQNRADLSVAERFRQVLEAYKIEIEYGRTMDSYKEVILVEGQNREVSVLRIGRLALLFQTPDKKMVGFWNQKSQEWQLMDESHYKAAISQGVRMAKKQISLDIMTIPVPVAEAVK